MGQAVMGQGSHPDHPPTEGGYTGQMLDDHQGGWKEVRPHHDDVYLKWAPGVYVETYAAMIGKVKGILVTRGDELLFIPYEIIRKVALLDKYVLLNPEEAGKLR